MTIFELYKKCIKGECNPEEASRVELWLKEHPEAFEAEMLSEILKMDNDQPLPSGVRAEMLAHFSQRGITVGAGATTGRVAVMHGKRNGRKIRWVAAAAIILVALAGGWMYQSGGTRQKITWTSIENSSNGVKLVILPDSSRIWLNAFSRIRYAFNGEKASDRNIELTGEAYFKVYSRSGQLFTVQTGDVRTRVLGTEFNVEAYPDERMVRICLQEGKVQVSCLDGKGVATNVRLLAPGQAATYHKDSSRLYISRTISDMPQAWIHEGLVLNDASLEDALRRISRKYNEKIVFDAGEAGRFRHITAYYRKMNTGQILSQLGFTCDFSVKKDNNTYKVFFRHDRGAAPAPLSK
jgi:transmembrane sensor